MIMPFEIYNERPRGQAQRAQTDWQILCKGGDNVHVLFYERRCDRFKNLQVLLSDEEYEGLEKRAEEKGVPKNVYIRSLLLGEADEFSNAYMETIARVEALAPGTKFNLKALFGTDWTQSRGTKLTLGKTFYEMVESGYVKTAKVLGKDSSNIMQYERV